MEGHCVQCHRPLGGPGHWPISAECALKGAVTHTVAPAAPEAPPLKERAPTGGTDTPAVKTSIPWAQRTLLNWVEQYLRQGEYFGGGWRAVVQAKKYYDPPSRYSPEWSRASCRVPVVHSPLRDARSGAASSLT
jgi:hypothetical protein